MKERLLVIVLTAALALAAVFSPQAVRAEGGSTPQHVACQGGSQCGG